jgi:hypothetical protein
MPKTVLERAADAREFPRSSARRAIRSFRAATRDWPRAHQVLAERFFFDLLRLTGEALEVIFSAAEPEAPAVPAPTDPVYVAELWQRLERRTPRQRLLLVEEVEEFQNRALSELVSAKSIEIAPTNPAEARELAELALRIAELYPS